MPSIDARASRPWPRRWSWLLAALVCALAACQTDLHSKLSEPDANEMLGALLAAGIDAKKKTPDAGKTWSITVQDSETVQAIQVLRQNALPRERRPSLGDLFKKEGLISSPTEERVRFIYGVEQELSETVSRIDGVMVARVHIVLPNNDPLATNTRPSSASIFVKHRRSADLQTLVPAIKNLVVHAVEGLDYNLVTVTMVSAMPMNDAAERADGAPAAPAAATATSKSRLGPILAGCALVLVLLLAGAGVLVVKRGRPEGLARALGRLVGVRADQRALVETAAAPGR